VSGVPAGPSGSPIKGIKMGVVNNVVSSNSSTPQLLLGVYKNKGMPTTGVNWYAMFCSQLNYMCIYARVPGPVFEMEARTHR
jgi:hypothetical protein